MGKRLYFIFVHKKGDSREMKSEVDCIKIINLFYRFIQIRILILINIKLIKKIIRHFKDCFLFCFNYRLFKSYEK